MNKFLRSITVLGIFGVLNAHAVWEFKCMGRVAGAGWNDTWLNVAISPGTRSEGLHAMHEIPMKGENIQLKDFMGRDYFFTGEGTYRDFGDGDFEITAKTEDNKDHLKIYISHEGEGVQGVVNIRDDDEDTDVKFYLAFENDLCYWVKNNRPWDDSFWKERNLE